MNIYQDNSTKGRTIRTVLQALIGVIVANLDVIVGVLEIPTELKPVIVALVMVILSPVMSNMGLEDKDAIEQDGGVDYREIIESEPIEDNRR